MRFYTLIFITLFFLNLNLFSQANSASPAELTLVLTDLKYTGDSSEYVGKIITNVFNQVIESTANIYWRDEVLDSGKSRIRGERVDFTLKIDKRGGRYSLTMLSENHGQLTEDAQNLRGVVNSVRLLVNQVAETWYPESDFSAIALVDTPTYRNEYVENVALESLYFLTPIMSTLLHNYFTMFAFQQFWAGEENYSFAVRARINRDPDFENFETSSDQAFAQYQTLSAVSLGTGYIGSVTAGVTNFYLSNDSLSMTASGKITYSIGLTLLQLGGLGLQYAAWYDKGLQDTTTGNFNNMTGSTNILNLTPNASIQETSARITLYNNLSQVVWISGAVLAGIAPFLTINDDPESILASNGDKWLHTSGLALSAVGGALFSYATTQRFSALQNNTSQATSEIYLYSALGASVGGLLLSLYPILYPEYSKKIAAKKQFVSWNLIPNNSGGLALNLSYQY